MQVVLRPSPIDSLYRRLVGLLTVWAERHGQGWAFLAGIVLCAIGFGAIVATQVNPQDILQLNHVVSKLVLSLRFHQTIQNGALWSQKFAQDMQVLALLWVFGLSIIGMPLIVITIFVRAFGTGFTITYTVIHFGWRGLVIAGLGVSLHDVISLAAFIVAGSAALRLSGQLWRQALPKSTLFKRLGRYSTVYVCSILGLALSAAVQACVSPALLRAILGH